VNLCYVVYETIILNAVLNLHLIDSTSISLVVHLEFRCFNLLTTRSAVWINLYASV